MSEPEAAGAPAKPRRRESPEIQRLVGWYIVAAQVAADTILLGFALGFEFHRLFFPVGAAIGALRLNKAVRRNKLTLIVYWLLILITLDFVVSLWYSALRGKNPVYIPIIIGIYAAFLAARTFFKVFAYLTPIQLFIVPIVVTSLAMVVNFSQPSCLLVDNQPGVSVIAGTQYELAHHEIPRFFISRPEKGDMLICNHTGHFEERRIHSYAINRLDVKTGKLTPWRKKGEVMGIARDEAAGRIYALLRKNHSDAETPNMSFNVFDDSGRLLETHSLGLSRNTYYIGTVENGGDFVVAMVENNYYLYEKGSRRFRRLAFKNGAKPMYAATLDGKNLYTCHTTNLLLMMLSGMPHANKFNLETNTRERKFNGLFDGNLAGFYSIVPWPGRDLFALSQAWIEGGMILNKNLMFVKKIKVPRGVREIEFTADGKFLVMAGFFDGKAYFLEPLSNRIVADVYIGAESRGILRRKDGKIVLGTACGVVVMDPETILKNKLHGSGRKPFNPTDEGE